ncbi:MAG: AAA family ATPase, partial [Acidobacteria bacterium]|nr:AAA family ATPase [Acidobacteriota bacterium]
MPAPQSTPGETLPNRGVDRAADGRSPAHADVARQLDRILAHPLFQASHRLSAFLRFVVQTSLAGRAEQLKEHVIGVEVFERGGSYSPQEDPVVRIMAGRLRSKLAEYYQGSGHSDPVRIELPRGGYVPRCGWGRQPAAAQTVPESQPLPPPPRGASVGREAELSRLREAFASVSTGNGAMLTVSGDAGMGKTTVAEDFLVEIETQSAAAWVGRGRCSERLAETDAFAPILETLERLLRGESGDQAAQIMTATAPAWLPQVSPATGESAEAAAKEARTASHERMRREFVSFFEQLSRTRPVVLFFDDLHWADSSTCDLLAYLGARLRGIRILILLTYRPAAVLARRHPFLPLKLDLERRGVCQDLPLSFLSLNDIERYIALQFPVNAFPPEFGRVVHERKEGNPLFMTDMLRYLRDHGILAERDGRWRLEQPVSEVRQL